MESHLISSPLYEVARSYIKEELRQEKTNDGLPQQNESSEEQIVERTLYIIKCLLKEEMKPEEALETSEKENLLTNSIQKICNILRVGNRPIRKYRAKPRQISGRLQGRNWSQNEDNRLLLSIHRFGFRWYKISSFVGNSRSPSQCSQRWFRSLNPKISRSPWTSEEEEKLIALVKKYGKKNWNVVAQKLVTRNDVQCRYHYKHMNGKLSRQSYQSVSTQINSPLIMPTFPDEKLANENSTSEENSQPTSNENVNVFKCPPIFVEPPEIGTQANQEKNTLPQQDDSINKQPDNDTVNLKPNNLIDLSLDLEKPNPFNFNNLFIALAEDLFKWDW
ncbi:Myb-like DNA-binding domain containing protein [Tritrichomonas foetus]|uniref:Myb-like DNA-binding domain containing protein n=1 Tax=Tritrichomonas foetus TaxID=1144522 RepID=A0A1J4KNP6_9EUKA|nr:Myb-like DNA-binding domain containing protein [Tritrichomonas foetus]|eukprot:OHT11037.1 Myb-like DNA-binding domain containing protein [Tritrichomonas foetus]